VAKPYYDRVNIDTLPGEERDKKISKFLTDVIKKDKKKVTGLWLRDSVRLNAMTGALHRQETDTQLRGFSTHQQSTGTGMPWTRTSRTRRARLVSNLIRVRHALRTSSAARLTDPPPRISPLGLPLDLHKTLWCKLHPRKVKQVQRTIASNPLQGPQASQVLPTLVGSLRLLWPY
jgi:hypothetical protein